MKRTVKHIFKTKSVVIDVTDLLSMQKTNGLIYTKAEKIIFDEGKMTVQYFNHFLFYLERTTYELNSDLEAEFLNKKTRFFLFMMLKGTIAFFTNEKSPIMEAKENTCYATYNRKGTFHYKLLKGTHEFFYLCPRIAWLGKHDELFPRIGKFLGSMRTDRKLFGHMSTCFIDKNMRVLLKHLFYLQNSTQIDFEFNILKSISTIINHYQNLLDSQFSHRAYLIKEYLETHYFEFIDNKELANQFYTTEKTLIKTFRQKFGTTPYNYLISLRMEQAKYLLAQSQLPPSKVYSKVGYSDFHSFRKQFKNYFGVPPSEIS